MTQGHGVRLAGRIVAFPLPIPVLVPSDGVPDLVIEWFDPPFAAAPALHPLVLDREGAPWLLAGPAAEGWVLLQPGSFEARMDVAAARVRVRRLREASESVWEHLLVNVLVPHLLALRGRLVLHAGAVAPPDEDVAHAWVGEQGRGKSTRVARRLAEGWRLVADDFLVVDLDGVGPVVHPGPRVVRLWGDSLEAVGGGAWKAVARPTAVPGKWAVRSADAGFATVAGPLPLVSIEVMDPLPPDSVPGARSAFLALHDAAFRMDVTDPRTLADELDRLATPALLSRIRWRDRG